MSDCMRPGSQITFKFTIVFERCHAEQLSRHFSENTTWIKLTVTSASTKGEGIDKIAKYSVIYHLKPAQSQKMKNNPTAQNNNN